MAKKTQTGTDVEQVKQQNAGQSGQFGTEFGSETNVQEVKQQNQQAENRKRK
ncbi:gamma-type small acid-soluble spore protein [Bacillus massiliglaciei]|uniref:gamma-type small acid-soluble spore protein n=1 Tax=Bacillus massiliglaciei TaxID=1816693 RepID=UPI000A890BC2|nr:gamma-type small acid-soluble spore protein [Bacillus massiliglaciei]